LTLEDGTFMSSELLGSDDSGLFYDIPEGDTQSKHRIVCAAVCTLVQLLRSGGDFFDMFKSSVSNACAVLM
jgi:hypothetical protein